MDTTIYSYRKNYNCNCRYTEPKPDSNKNMIAKYVRCDGYVKYYTRPDLKLYKVTKSEYIRFLYANGCLIPQVIGRFDKLMAKIN